MKHLYKRLFGWIVFLTLCLSFLAAHAEQQFRAPNTKQQIQYRYVSFKQFVPSGFRFFDPTAINNRGHVYGTIYDASYNGFIADYANGVFTILQPGYAHYLPAAVNERGTVGGFVINTSDSQSQAALFHGKRLELVLRQPGESSSQVIAVNDKGTALVQSFDESGSLTYVLYRKGKSIPLYFDQYFTPEFVNNHGNIVGTLNEPGNGLRGFLHDPFKDETTLLHPLPADSDSWIQDVNNRGDVLGYSFIYDAKESIGVWDHKGTFKTYFTQGIEKFPTISNKLLFNDRNLIVITLISSPSHEKNTSYLVTKPGVRLDLSKLISNLPSQQHPNWILDVNNDGSMIGHSAQSFNIQDTFLLERVHKRNK